MKECTNKSMLKKTVQLLPWLWLAAGYILDMWYQLVPGHKMVDSDLASDMILANILNRDHSLLLTHNWCYSTEIKVVGLPMFYRIGLLLFPDNWTAAEPLVWPLGWRYMRRWCLRLPKLWGCGRLVYGWQRRCCGRLVAPILCMQFLPGITFCILFCIWRFWLYCCEEKMQKAVKNG